jgi:MFS transporter, MHS family, proline/betaine transporter
MTGNFSLKHIAIICAGTFLEVYDSYIFAFLMPEISKNFLKFSAYNNILTALSFSIIFLIRPISGVIWGILGDSAGKSWVFRNAMLFMAIVTMLIGLLPTYDQIGIAAPILLFTLRIMQGISISGELSSAVVLCFEQSNPERRYKNQSLLYTFLFGGFVTASLVVLLFKNTSVSFSWRFPMICGGVFGFLVYLVRRKIQFPERTYQVSLVNLFTHYLKPVLFGIFANCLINLNWLYIMTSNTILEKNKINSPHTPLICGIIAIISCFFSGQFFFKQGFKQHQIPLIIIVSVILHVIIISLLCITHNPKLIPIFYYSQAALSGLTFTAIPLLIIAASPEFYRNSIYTISVNTSTAIIVGGLPLILTSIIHLQYVNIYLLLMGLGVMTISLIGIVPLQKRIFNQPIPLQAGE